MDSYQEALYLKDADGLWRSQSIGDEDGNEVGITHIAVFGSVECAKTVKERLENLTWESIEIFTMFQADVWEIGEKVKENQVGAGE